MTPEKNVVDKATNVREILHVDKEGSVTKNRLSKSLIEKSSPEANKPLPSKVVATKRNRRKPN